MSSATTATPSRPCNAACSLLWNSFGAEDITKGSRRYLYLHVGPQKVVSQLERSLKRTCINPYLTSKRLNTLAPPNKGRTSSMVGI